MTPKFPSNFNRRHKQPATAAADVVPDRWSAADIAAAAERGAAYLARQVLPAFDPSDPRPRA